MASRRGVIDGDRYKGESLKDDTRQARTKVKDKIMKSAVKKVIRPDLPCEFPAVPSQHKTFFDVDSTLYKLYAKVLCLLAILVVTSLDNNWSE